ncbi:MAG: alpha/beta fold hydrolase [Mucilaginibacter sp.]|uniref:thioesterase II family protein n=1 Tax=Mucilaginibacter sp. TaxID=1882438 RepID=UPI0031A9E3E0
MYRPNRDKTLLLALPYAGANSYCYSFLAPLLPPNILFETLEYPGRGDLGHLSLVNHMQVLVDNLIDQYRALVNDLSPGKVVLYGHSIGAVVGLAMLHTSVSQKELLYPYKAIFSGHGAPALTSKKALVKLSDEALINYFQNIGSLSKEVAAEKDLMDYILPILRNDLELYESTDSYYREKLHLPLVIINGNRDEILQQHIQSWKEETLGHTSFYELEGHHLFISQYPFRFSRLITTVINND